MIVGMHNDFIILVQRMHLSTNENFYSYSFVMPLGVRVLTSTIEWGKITSPNFKVNNKKKNYSRYKNFIFEF